MNNLCLLLWKASCVCTFLQCVYRETAWSVLILHLTGEIILLFVRKESRWCRDYANVVFPFLQMPVKSFDLGSHPDMSDITTHLFVYLSFLWFVHRRLYVLLTCHLLTQQRRVNTCLTWRVDGIIGENSTTFIQQMFHVDQIYKKMV